MDLSKIVSISGKSGLFQIISQSNNGVIIESLLDGKRLKAFSHERMSNLDEIRIYSTAEEVPLIEVFKKISDKHQGKKVIDPKSTNEELISFFEDVFPEYDKERVYASNIKKIVQWYNLLVEKEMMHFEKEEPKNSADDKPADDKPKEEPAEKKIKESKKK